MQSLSYANSREEIVKVGKLSWELGLNSLFSGNISIMLPNRDILITKTGKSLRELDGEEDLVIVRDSESSRGQASCEFFVHRGIYQIAGCGEGAVLHCHPPYSIAASFVSGDCIQPSYNEARDVLGPTRIVESQNRESLGEDPSAVGRALSMNKVVAVRGHGTFALANTIEQCLYLTHLLETSCRVMLLKNGR
jgi:L-fuculose-phosphate aldolase